MTMPTISAKENPCIISPPNKNSTTTVMSVVPDVSIVLVSVAETDSFIIVSRCVLLLLLIFSLIRSKTMIVSFSE